MSKKGKSGKPLTPEINPETGFPSVGDMQDMINSAFEHLDGDDDDSDDDSSDDESGDEEEESDGDVERLANAYMEEAPIKFKGLTEEVPIKLKGLTEEAPVKKLKKKKGTRTGTQEQERERKQSKIKKKEGESYVV